MTRRQDQHRPGAIVPADYQHVLSYHRSTTYLGYPIQAFAVDCERVVIDGKREKHGNGDRCCIARLRAAGHRFAETGATGKCSICGASFIYGDVWQHRPSGVMLHLGHDCADKYAMMADRSAAELALGREKAAVGVEIKRRQNAEERAAFLANHAGLAEALETDHAIVKNIARWFDQNRWITDKQIALVFKLATDAKAPRRPDEANVPAPTGKQTFRGRVVSIKNYEGRYNNTVMKMTVKVATEQGVWMAWGSVPKLQERPHDFVHVGDVLEIKATLQAGREPHFVFFKRPRATLIATSLQEAS